MTIEQIDRAIKVLEREFDKSPIDGWKRMLGTALAALRECRERMNPAPLTLEELREMGGKPVNCPTTISAMALDI